MIKRYLNLNDLEKNSVMDFVNRNGDSKKSLTEIDNMFNNKMYGYGRGSLFYFLDNQIIGKINVVLEVVKELGTIYIHHLDILEEIDNQEVIIKELIDNAIMIAREFNPKEILLGERNEKRLIVLEQFDLHSEYRSLRMYLEDRSGKENCLDLIPLSKENKIEYLSVYNDSFSDMPHGSYIDIDEVEKYIQNFNEENYYFMVSTNNINIGFMNCIIKNGQSLFDIGLCKKYRGKGYGKCLLETAIDFLNRKNVLKINLTVIEKNAIAHNMYKKRGFKEESTISYWIKIK